MEFEFSFLFLTGAGRGLLRGLEIDHYFTQSSTGLTGLQWRHLETSLGEELMKNSTTKSNQDLVCFDIYVHCLCWYFAAVSST